MLTCHKEIMWYTPQGKFISNTHNIYYWYECENYLLLITVASPPADDLLPGYPRSSSDLELNMTKHNPCTRTYWYHVTGIFCMTIHGTIWIRALPSNTLQGCSTRPSAGRVSELLRVWAESICPCLHAVSILYSSLYYVDKYWSTLAQVMACYLLCAMPSPAAMPTHCKSDP